jgi:hypothetical protein
MAVKTPYFCDKCGGENRSKMPSYSLMSEDVGMTHGYCTPRMELCPQCRNSLLEVLAEWGMGQPSRRKSTAA